jgi:hypothetical protein
MVQYGINVIRNRYLYTVVVSCSKPLYPQYANQMKQIGDSFTFAASAIAAPSGVGRKTEDERVTFTWPRESPAMSLLKALGTVWFQVLVVTILLAIGSAVWAMVRKKGAETPNQSTDNDKE